MNDKHVCGLQGFDGMRGDICPVCQPNKATTEVYKLELATITDVELRERFLLDRLEVIVKWLEQNQPDVFSRGLWDALSEKDNG